jgi:ribokinase
VTSDRGGVCVLASFMMDISVRVPRRPAVGETVMGTSADFFLGGKGFNQAIAAARAGAPTGVIGRVGADEWGGRFVDCLEAEGIDASHVRADPDEGTGLGMPVVEPSGDNAIIVVPRANTRVSWADVRGAQSLVASSSVLLLQLELPFDVVLGAAMLAREVGTTVVLNPAPAVGDLEMFAGLVDVLVPNAGEAAWLSGRGSGPPDPEGAARDLAVRTGAAVVVTLGSEGVFVLDGTTTARIAAHPVDAVDTVAAGDVFCGSLGARLAAGATLADACAYANAAAAVAVTRPGSEPSIPTTAEVAALTGVS